MKKTRKPSRRRGLFARYRRLPAALRSPRAAERRNAHRLLLATLCALVMLACAAYILSWELTRLKIERDNAAYSALYPVASATAPPSPTRSAARLSGAEASPESSDRATDAPVEPSPGSQSALPAQSAEAFPSPTISESPKPPEASPAESASARAASTPAATPPAFEIARDATRAPLATPDAETHIYALETPPPTQSSFADLLATNPDTVGFLRIGDVLALPVVQRQNDNAYYLNHSFSLEESIAGTLFLDGANRLVPEDACLIVYGHNMRNGTMFHSLCDYDALDFLKAHALVRFDTIYQDRTYVPFAVLTVTADPGSARHVDIRRFAFDGADFEDYVDALRSLSVWDIPVDVAWGDSILLLVTCEYTHNNGRFVVALRALRDGEGEDEMRALVQTTKAR